MRLPVVLVVAALLAACAGDGTTLREPGTGGSTARAGLFSGAEGIFALRSPVFPGDGVIPDEYRDLGDGATDLWPELQWQEVPDGTVELALVMEDFDEDSRRHWIVRGIDPAVGGFAAGELPAGAVQVTNDFGTLRYEGPIAPVEGDPHTIVFRLYALRAADAAPPADATPADVVADLERRTIETTLLVGKV